MTANLRSNVMFGARVCRQCHVLKHLNAYTRDSRAPLGRRVTCRSCRNRIRRSQRECKPAMYRTHWQRWDKEHRPERREADARRAETARRRAQLRCKAAVARALRDGRLTKGVCEACGALDVEAHHEDYDRPLDVNWLCPKHHARLHADRRRRERE